MTGSGGKPEAPTAQSAPLQPLAASADHSESIYEESAPQQLVPAVMAASKAKGDTAAKTEHTSEWASLQVAPEIEQPKTATTAVSGARDETAAKMEHTSERTALHVAPEIEQPKTATTAASRVKKETAASQDLAREHTEDQAEQPSSTSMAAVEVEDGTMAVSTNAPSHAQPEHRSAMSEKVGDQIQNTIFDVEAVFGSAVHHLHMIPAKRLPAMTRHDGSVYDPNPLHVMYPGEVAEVLTAMANQVGGVLASLAESITGRKHSQYAIPAKLISAAMTRDDGATFSEKKLFVDIGRALDVSLGPPPPRRTAAPSQESSSLIKEEKKAVQTVNAKPEATRKARKAKPELKQNYRASPKNGVYIYLEATEQDIARAHKTPDGRKLWAAKGIFWPPGTIFDEGNSSMVAQGLAKYCKNIHTPWCVLVSGDVGNCNECDHQDFITVDIYLPLQTRAHFLRWDCGVNEKGELCTIDGFSKALSPVPQPNLLTGLRVASDPAFWSLGQTFVRSRTETPSYILKAYGTGEIDKIIAKGSKSISDPSIRKKSNGKPVLVPKFKQGTRHFENGGCLKAAIQTNKDLADFPETKNFHIQRMKHIWDFSDLSEKAFDTLVGNMIKKVQEYYTLDLLQPAQFDIDSHWFTRKDVDEFNRARALSTLLLEVAQTSDPIIKKSTSKGRGKDIVDLEIEEYKKKMAASTPESSKRRAESHDFLGRPKKRPKKIKVEEGTKDLRGGSDTAVVDNEGGEGSVFSNLGDIKDD